MSENPGEQPECDYEEGEGSYALDEIHKDMASKWALPFGGFHDPGLSFEKIYIAKGKNKEQREIAKRQKEWLETGYRCVQECQIRKTSHNITIDIDDPLNDAIIADDLLILVKISRINSITRVKEDVCKLIDAHFTGEISPLSSVELPPQASDDEHEVLMNTWFRGGSRGKERKYNVGFDDTLKIGDWIDQDQITPCEAAEKAYPEHYNDTEDEIGDPEGAIRKVRKVSARYKYFIEKGFMKITAA
jgi:hypothetical protein